ncbi:MAG: helix-turn-helix domain-containing protein [Xanthomonadales bacterium]|nr:helix-turn-helix domain-containing protein [Xanthomonadales bacterium]
MSRIREYQLDDLEATVLCTVTTTPVEACAADLCVLWSDPSARDHPGPHGPVPEIVLTTDPPEGRQSPGLCLNIRFQPGSRDGSDIMRFAGHRLPIPTHIEESLADCLRVLELDSEGQDAHSKVHGLWAGLESYLIDLSRRLAKLPGRSMEHRLGIFTRLEAARRLLEREVKSRRCVAQAADRASMSRSHFIRTFKAFYGETPKQVRITRRLEMAKRLLRHSSLSVAEISTQTGFGNRCAFHRLFRERTGETPNEYRERRA